VDDAANERADCNQAEVRASKRFNDHHGPSLCGNVGKDALGILRHEMMEGSEHGLE
jgi:hypothetical protein